MQKFNVNGLLLVDREIIMDLILDFQRNIPNEDREKVNDEYLDRLFEIKFAVRSKFFKRHFEPGDDLNKYIEEQKQKFKKLK